jgi:hypothetical protein
MKLRHAAALALRGAALGFLVPFSYLTLFSLGIIRSAPDWLLWVWPSGLMLLALDLCCGKRAPKGEVVKVVAESITVDVILYSALALSIGAGVGKLRKIKYSKNNWD